MTTNQTDTGLHTHGRFVWHDLFSPDRARSVDFFTRLIGWTTRGEDAATADYVHFVNAGEDLGGAPKFEAGPHAPPPHWNAYVTVEDVAATIERAKRLGGTLVHGPETIERVGTFAVIQDPTGGVLSVFRLSHGEKPETDAPPAGGTFCWNELMSTDPERAAGFYGELFNWGWDAMDMGPMGTYRVAKRNGQQTAGLMKTMVPGHSYWLNYIAVADVDAKTREARELGAKVVAEPMDIPGIGRAAVLADPTGVHFALFQGA